MKTGISPEIDDIVRLARMLRLLCRALKAVGLDVPVDDKAA